jgi:hypothetical protein
VTPEARLALAQVISELETDVAQARTRDESIRLTRRVLSLRQVLASASSLPLSPGSEPLTPAPAVV